MVLIPASSLHLIWNSYRRGYIIIWHPPTSCERHICTQFNPSTLMFIPWYLRPDAPVIYTGAFLLLIAWPGSICYNPTNHPTNQPSIFDQSTGGGCRIHWFHLCKVVIPSTNECLEYDTKQSDREVPVMLELWGMQSTLSLPLLLGPLSSGVVEPDRVLSIGQIEINLC